MTRPQTSVTNTKDLSLMPIITNMANSILENIVLFFLALFVSLCGGGSSNSNVASAAHLIFIPQQRKSLYRMLKKTSDQDQSQINVKNCKKTHKSKKSHSHSTHSCSNNACSHHRSTSAHSTTNY
ncbi:9648_t:CDS:2 [Scutellospora calospora]|uniref:9648_t:CDS:1 n=1 Tax=Scutellospora calospora TaxID=85575 RepID=A0ACA9L273_9GLOM|nr:9648_t:CDS:2 [Scutellospora calospora]